MPGGRDPLLRITEGKGRFTPSVEANSQGIYVKSIPPID